MTQLAQIKTRRRLADRGLALTGTVSLVLLSFALVALGENAAWAGGPTSIQGGGYHTCAVTSVGGVKCWGKNVDGQLGDGTRVARSIPGDVSGLTSGVLKGLNGGLHSCVVTSAGGVKCWGSNGGGQLGDGTLITRLLPVDVVGLTSGVQHVATGDLHSCALTTAGGVKCWGHNEDGQLGDGTFDDHLTPQDVSGLTSGVIAIATGDYFSCAVKLDGSASCWGRNVQGQLGNNSRIASPSPVDVQGLTGPADTIAAGDSHTCARLTTGGLMCWGYNMSGQLGDETHTTRLTAVPVSGLSSGVAKVWNGGYHTCALMSSGGLKCWGDNSWGQLGDGTDTAASKPQDVPGLTSGVTTAGVGFHHTCAITTSGVLCWGANGSGQLGDGTQEERWSPVPIQDFALPVLGSIAPTSMPAGRRFTLVVSGSGFDHDSIVMFNGNPCATTWISANELRALIVPGMTPAPGTVQVHVFNPAMGANSGSKPFTIEHFAQPPGRDFNGDGQADIIWESSAGWVAAWLMNGTTQIQNLLLYDYPVAVDGWHIAGTGDLNGDGESDIVWQSDTGYVAAWLMNRTTQMFNQLLYQYPVAVDGWRIAAVGDLDADGISDLLWLNTLNGYTAYWLMGAKPDGTTYQRHNALLDPRPVALGGWSIVATGDLNGDLTDDIVWQNEDGYVAAWLMRGASQIFSTLLYPVPVAVDGWTVVGTADLSGDRMVDLLWQKRPTSPADTTYGYVATWFMNSVYHAGTSPLTPPRIYDPTWMIVGPK